MSERQPLRDDTTHRVSDDVAGIPANGLHKCGGIIGHLLDRKGFASGRCALADAPVVKGQQPVIGSESIHLRLPAVANDADSLNEQHRLAFVAMELVVQTDSVMKKLRHDRMVVRKMRDRPCPLV